MNRSDKKRNTTTAQANLLKKLTTMLEKPDKLSHSTKGFADLLYGLEKLGRSLYSDQNQEFILHHFKAAVENLEQVAQTQYDTEQEISLCLSSGKTYAQLGFLNEAAEIFKRGIELSKTAGDQKNQAVLLRQLANIETKQNRLDAALKHLKTSLRISKGSGELKEQSSALNSMSVAYFHKADWRNMKKASEAALAIAEKIDEKPIIASVYNNLGAMYSLRGDWDQALLSFKRGMTLFEQLGDSRGLAECHNNLATLYRDREMWAEAGSSYMKSIRLATESGDEFVKTSAMLNRVELYILMHDLDMAEAQCRKALNCFHHLGRQQGVADACKLLGVIYTMKHDWHLAGNYFKEALRVNKNQSSLLGLAETHKEYAQLFISRDQKEKARTQLEKALEYYKALKASKEQQRIKKRIQSLR